jgi:hypothetical protein
MIVDVFEWIPSNAVVQEHLNVILAQLVAGVDVQTKHLVSNPHGCS